MKIFAATLATETSTAAVVPTGRVDFEAQGLYFGDASVRDPEGLGCFHAEIKRLAAADGHSVVDNAWVIDRGYENITGKLQKLGAHIERVD